MNYLFDFELTDAEYKDNEDKFPIASVAMNHLPPINMKITLRESVKEIEKDLAWKLKWLNLKITDFAIFI